ncbi:hypothetical protein EZS27_027406 [termite gut metagenome]|uniref:DUF5119 domain-containing protein n=1 Tax=termite gut metagenome TaxID=433724 RepID=A0A5J4QRA3_9ZZZZ
MSNISKEEGFMSKNKWLLFLLYIMGVCAACTNEDVVRRKEGEVTIVPLWENYAGRFRPDKINYYFYNIYDHSSFPVVVEDSTGIGVITQVLPVGIYRLAGYNTNVSADVILDTTKYLTVVAKFPSYPYTDYVPLNLCIISSEEIIIYDKDVITKEILPVEVKTKSLELIFRPSEDITINQINGTLDGAFASINLVNGRAFEDESDIFFKVDDPVNNKKVKFRISDVYSPSAVGFPSYKESKLSLTLEVKEGGKTKTKKGEFILNDIIEDIRTNKIPDDAITLYVDISSYKKLEEKVNLDVTLSR